MGHDAFVNSVYKPYVANCVARGLTLVIADEIFEEYMNHCFNEFAQAGRDVTAPRSYTVDFVLSVLKDGLLYHLNTLTESLKNDSAAGNPPQDRSLSVRKPKY